MKTLIAPLFTIMYLSTSHAQNSEQYCAKLDSCISTVDECQSFFAKESGDGFYKYYGGELINFFFQGKTFKIENGTVYFRNEGEDSVFVFLSSKMSIGEAYELHLNENESPHIRNQRNKNTSQFGYPILSLKLQSIDTGGNYVFEAYTMYTDYPNLIAFNPKKNAFAYFGMTGSSFICGQDEYLFLPKP
jgi:hypothetical protein